MLLTKPIPSDLPKNTNAEWDHICAVIEDNIDFRKTVSECIIDRYESDEDDDEKTIEEKIYGGFYSNEDKSILEEFQLALGKND